MRGVKMSEKKGHVKCSHVKSKLMRRGLFKTHKMNTNNTRTYSYGCTIRLHSLSDFKRF